MSLVSGSHTHQSLIMLMADGGSSSDAWTLFVEKYGRKLYLWSRQWCTNHHDAEELVQETILVVFRKIGVFRCHATGGFRNWLKEISFRCWQEMLARKKKFDRPLNDHSLAYFKQIQMDDQAARSDLERLFESIADQEILDLAIFKARTKVREKTWRTFELIDLENKPVEDVTRHQNMTRGAVHTAVYTVRKLIREEIGKLEAPTQPMRDTTHHHTPPDS